VADHTGYTAAMPYLIGVDEAGYGPNLGPLVISATAWHVPRQVCCGGRDAVPDLELYDVLSSAVSRSPDERRIAIADSKLLYKPGGGLRLLERGVLPVLQLTGQTADDWNSLLESLAADPHAARTALPWYQNRRQRLPTTIDAETCGDLANKLQSACASAGARPVAIASRTVFPAEFNHHAQRHGSKGVALSHFSLSLVAGLLSQLGGNRATDCNGPGNGHAYGHGNGRDTPLPAEPTLVVCDKHGGRNHYQPLLQQHFPDTLVEVHGQSRAVSIYRWGPAEQRIEMQFCTGGESFLPTALASMTSKYVRELAMQALNSFWCRQIEGLRPTAGYPVDARRFKREITPRQQALGIADSVLWRVK